MQGIAVGRGEEAGREVGKLLKREIDILKK